MEFLRNVNSAVTNPVSMMPLASGPTGFAPTATRDLFGSVFSTVIQNLGSQTGLPQSETNRARSAGGFGGGSSIGQTVSNLGRQFNLSPAQQGELQRVAQDFTTNLTSLFLDRLRGGSNNEDSQAGGSGGKGGGSLLIKIAMALGKLLDEKMSRMAGVTDQIGTAGGDPNQSTLGQLTGELQGLSQEVSILSNAMTNTIKTIGEANSTNARK